MTNDRDSDKHTITDYNYNVSIDGNCVHYYVLEDDYKITITIFPEGTFDGTKKGKEETKETRKED
jgi:hypothetical protein